jgi:hypothetical protein
MYRKATKRYGNTPSKFSYYISQTNQRLGPISAKATSLGMKSASNLRMAKTLSRIGAVAGVGSLLFGMYDLGRMLSRSTEKNFMQTEQNFRSRQKVYSEEEYFDTRAAFTQRQRALQVIHNSQLGVRAALGAESNYMHY